MTARTLDGGDPVVRADEDDGIVRCVGGWVHVAAAAAMAFALASAAAAADGCDALRAQIETKIRNAGVEQFTLAVVDAAASAPGKVVGSCDRGAKSIVYARGPVAGEATPPSNSASGAQPQNRPKTETILTECKDGTVAVGGRCGK